MDEKIDRIAIGFPFRTIIPPEADSKPHFCAGK